MSPSNSKGYPCLPDWADELPLSRDSRRILARVLRNQTEDIERQVADLLQLGGHLEQFLEEVRVIVEEGDRFLRESVELARSYQVPEDDLHAALGAIRRHSSGELRDVVSRIERLKRLAESLRRHRDAGIARGQALRIKTRMDETAGELQEQSCEDRGSAVYAIVESIYQRMRKDGPPLTQANFEQFLCDFSRRAFQAVRAKRKRGTRVRASIRDPRKRPQIKAEVTRMCSLIVLRDFTLRKVVKFSPAMLAALLRQVPSKGDMEEVVSDYRKLRCFPQHSRLLVMAGPLSRTFYFEGATEQEREGEIDPEVRAACEGPAPMQVVRVEYMTDEDVFLLGDALHPSDTVEAKVAPPHALAGRTVTMRSTLRNEFEVLAIEGESDSDAKQALQGEINQHPLKVLEAGFTVHWAEE